MSQDGLLRKVYTDICKGYSEALYNDEIVYIKHLNVFDQTEIDLFRDIEFNKAVSRGVKTEKDKLQWLAEKGLWNKKDEIELATQRGYVDNLEKTKGKLALKSQVDQMNKQLDEARNKLNISVNKRIKLIGLTAEQISEQRIQYEYIRISFFKDKKLLVPLFSKEDIGNLTDEQADHLLYSYISIINDFSSNMLRTIAISPFFTNYFYLCGENTYVFFLKPMVDLSIYQTNLLSYGQYFRSVMSQTEVPKEFANNPDKIEDYVARSRNLKSLVNKTSANADRVAIIGATSDDFKAMGVEDGSAIIHAEMKKGVRSGIEAAKNREVTLNPR